MKQSWFRLIVRVFAPVDQQAGGSTGMSVVVSISKKVFGLLSILAIAGCSETSFKDAFDMGKTSPDETTVQQNRSLTMPPDLQLRAPNGGGVPPAQVATTAQQPPVSTQPPQYGTAPQAGPAPQYGSTVPQQQAYLPPANASVTQPATPAAAPRQDVYSKHGISRTRPDGSKKTNAELIDELRTLKKKQQSAKNPNYGTVFNLPQVWSDSQ